MMKTLHSHFQKHPLFCTLLTMYLLIMIGGGVSMLIGEATNAGVFVPKTNQVVQSKISAKPASKELVAFIVPEFKPIDEVAKVTPPDPNAICKQVWHSEYDSLCQIEGQCTFKDGKCIVGSDEDCKQSEQCTDRGLCTAQEGKCIAKTSRDCINSNSCTGMGQCTAVDNWCTAKSVGDCRHSTGCPTHGACSLVENLNFPGIFYCGPSSDEECKQSSYSCKEAGKCIVSKDGWGWCAVESDLDCAQSTRCKSIGQCHANKEHSMCVTTDEGCQQSDRCKHDGKCHTNLSDDVSCITTTNNDCRQSDLCKKKGKCVEYHNSCVVSVTVEK